MENGKRVVIAVGGNAITKDKDKIAIKDQDQVIGETCSFIAQLVEDGWQPIISHGNGPQVGFLLRRAEIAQSPDLPTLPVYALTADTQGATGFMFSKNLASLLKKKGINKDVVALVTQAIVDKNDPAFANPSKPIGKFMDEAEAKQHEKEDGWEVREDSGRGWRRVISSPTPIDIVETGAIKTLVDAGYLVVAAGGGGVPVVKDGDQFNGVDAVIDKDLASALLANQLGVQDLVICTAVDQVAINFGKENQENLATLTVEEANKYIASGEFGKGSMEPKVQAAINFIENGGSRVIITSLECLKDALKGDGGTVITR